MPAAARDRIAALDLIRGVAVLGILAVNIAGFAGPSAATLGPHLPSPGSLADEATFAATFVVFEGKMRALFTLLFGAGLVLFDERALAAGRDGDLLQVRRLCWLMVFGLLHHFVLWRGDILFLYGFAGLVALFLRELSAKALVATALIVFAGWHLGSAAATLPPAAAEEKVRTGTASAAQAGQHAAFVAQLQAQVGRELAEYRSGLAAQVGTRLREEPLEPLTAALPNLGETLPLILLGMALQRSGFFAGAWPRRRLALLATVCGAAGLAATLALLAWLWPRGFPPQAMNLALRYWAALPHLLMALSYAALLVLAAPRLASTGAGRRLAAAGRMAFSNYLGTSLVMTAIFYGWGLGLIGRFGERDLLAFVLLGWALMLAGSAAWLARFRQGPLEWAWRSLVERRTLPLRH